MTIAPDSVVSMRYIMKNGKGLVLEDTMQDQPVSYLHGSPGIQPLLQSQLQGLKAGDTKTVYLYAAAGLTEEDFIFEVIIDQVREALKEEILLGYPVQVNVQPCKAIAIAIKDKIAGNMKIHLLSGFLGSGKTTAIQQASIHLIRQGIKTGVITNDQGTKLVDGDFFKSLSIPGRQVINGCFCCNYNDLDAGITSLIETEGTGVVFAESVGSCTDIVATVLKPLLHFRPYAQVTVSVFADVRLLQMILTGGANAFEETVRYIYLKQLEEAGIIVVNKIDLVNREELAIIKALMQEKYGGKILLYQHSLDPESILQWLHTLDDYQSAAALPSLHIDYDVYAEGEASLAWIDQGLEIFSSKNNALQLALELVNKIYKEIADHQYPIGHLKFLINESIKISFTGAMEPPVIAKMDPAASATLLINLRAQTMPGTITGLIENTVKETELQSGCRIITSSKAAFQPGYPRPVFRMQ